MGFYSSRRPIFLNACAVYSQLLSNIRLHLKIMRKKNTPEISQVALLSGTGTVSSAFPEGKKIIKIMNTI